MVYLFTAAKNISTSITLRLLRYAQKENHLSGSIYFVADSNY